jgi:hypothetical protein
MRDNDQGRKYFPNLYIYNQTKNLITVLENFPYLSFLKAKSHEHKRNA